MKSLNGQIYIILKFEFLIETFKTRTIFYYILEKERDDWVQVTSSVTLSNVISSNNL